MSQEIPVVDAVSSVEGNMANLSVKVPSIVDSNVGKDNREQSIADYSNRETIRSPNERGLTDHCADIVSMDEAQKSHGTTQAAEGTNEEGETLIRRGSKVLSSIPQWVSKSKLFSKQGSDDSIGSSKSSKSNASNKSLSKISLKTRAAIKRGSSSNLLSELFKEESASFQQKQPDEMYASIKLRKSETSVKRRSSKAMGPPILERGASKTKLSSKTKAALMRANSKNLIKEMEKGTN